MEGGDLCMSNSIDERIVRMKFDTAQFGPGAATVLKLLDQLKAALKLEGASQGLNDVNASMGRFSTAGAQEQVGSLSARFSALQVAAITALSNIVNKAVNAGSQLIKSLTLDPIMSGFHEYETNLNSIQTILANTGLKGAEGLQKVNDKLNDLNHYADQTIYNFSEMARNIGTFTAAGVTLDVATNAIKGIANLAAVSGSNAEQASAAMYQLSQALAAGKVTLEDWNSVVNAGMGGKVFQDALIETARVHGVAVDQFIKDEGSFRLSLQKGWLTSGILTETLSKFTGELTADQLKSMGYNKQQIAGILEMGKTAVDAATKVKTITQLMDTLREAVGSGWAQTWQIVFGNFDEAKFLFTDVSNVLGGMIQNSAKARNELLQGWKDLGGRQALIDGISNAFHALLSFLIPIKDAFREIFPATTAKQLFDLTVKFRDFMAGLKLGSDTANNLRRTFAGFFAILGIGWELLKAGVKFIFDLIGAFTGAGGGLLKFTGNIGDFLVQLHEAIKSGDAFGKFFSGLGKILQIPINLLKSLANLLGKLFSGSNDNIDAVSSSFHKMTDAMTPTQKVINSLKSAWQSFLKILDTIGNKLASGTKAFISWAKGIGTAIAGVFSGGLDFDAILGAINTGLFAGVVLLLKKFLSYLKNFKADGGFLDGVKDAIEGLTGSLKGMQNALNATALLTIALAIGVLTLAIIGLAKIDAGGLTRASVAIAVMFTQLGVAFKVFEKISTGTGALKVGVLAAGLILLAVAVDILASAVKKLSGMSWNDLAKGLVGLAVTLGVLVAASNALDTSTPGMLRAGAGMILLAAAVRILVTSVTELSGMSWGELAKGLTGVAVLLGSLALFTKFAEAGKVGLSSGVGIILLATALKILASAVGDFDKFNWEQLARGMAAIAVGLGLIVGAINLIPPGSVFKAAGVVVVSAALLIIANAVKKMSGMSWVEIAKGLTVMAVSLAAISLAIGLLPPSSIVSAVGILIVAAALEILANAIKKMGGMSWSDIAAGLTVLAVALTLMVAAMILSEASLPGAAAILIMAGALAVLAPVLKTLGAMSWSDIAAGLTALAGVFLVLGVAGLVLTPIVPMIAALAIAIGILGVAMLAAGVGVLAFAVAMTILAAAGAAGTAAVVALVKGLADALPYVAAKIGEALVVFAQVIAKAGPAILEAMTTVMEAMIDAIVRVSPKIIALLTSLLFLFLDTMYVALPKMVAAGFAIATKVLEGISKRLPDLIQKGGDVIIAFITGVGQTIPRITLAAITVVIAFINSMTAQIRASSGALSNAGANLAEALVEGVVRGLGSLAGRAVAAAANLAKKMLNAALGALGINSPSKEFYWIGQMMVAGVTDSLNENSKTAEQAAGDLGNNMIDSVSKTLSGLSAVLGTDLIDFNPTITPVLDLSQVKKDATSISDLLNLPEFNVKSAQNSAANAGSGFESNRSDGTDDSSTGSGTNYQYTQNNYSPKALDPVEIYRQTDNLISRTKRGES
jgi:tape measure domain-containing protein